MDDSAQYRIGDAWTRALKMLSLHDQSHVLPFQSDLPSVMDDVLSEVRTKRDVAMSKRWKFKKSDGTVIFLRDVFEKLLVRVSRYAQVMDLVSNADPIHVGLPWALLRFLLKVSVSDLHAFGSLNEGVELIAGVLVRYRILENVCASSTPSTYVMEQSHLSDCIVKNTVARIAKGILKNIEAENHTLQLAVSKADDDAFRTADIVQYQDHFNISKATKEALTDWVDKMRAPIFRIAQDVSQLQDHVLQNQRTEIFRWLSTVPCESHHHEACKGILTDTGKWLLQCSFFLNWQRSSSSAIFWLNGIPGSGKSKLTSIVIQKLLNQQAEACAQRSPLAYFYCSQKSTDPRTADVREILCALLRQLTGHDARLALRGTVAQDFQRRKEKADFNGAQILSLDIPEIKAHILDIAKDDPITLVLDALDEVDYANRGELFDALEQIVQESQNVVKLFVSSRTDGDIVERFEQHSKVRIDDLLNHDDIQRFIEHEVAKSIRTKKLLRGKVSPSLRDDIIKTLSKKANGMFRWVELSVDMLSNSRRLSVEKDIRSTLGQLPATLKEQYAAIYQEILESGSSTASIARRVFSWILAAQRALTVEEFIAAVALDDDGYYHDDLDALRLLDICRNLIVVVSTDDESSSSSFQVAHLSVIEYLKEVPEFSSERIHTLAMLRCLRAFDPQFLVRNQFSLETGGKPDPMRGYTIYLFEHAQMSELTGQFSTKAPLMKAFLFDNRHKSTPMLSDWISIVDEFLKDSVLSLDTKDIPFFHKMMYFDERNGVYLICSYGLLSILETLGNNVKVLWWKSYSSKYFPTPLFVATRNGKHAVAKWLLENNISDADEGIALPLLTAVWGEEIAIVNLLLKYGADPLFDGNDSYTSTPWNRAFAKKNLEIFQTLLGSIELTCETRPDKFSAFKFDWKNEALFAALLADWTEAVEILIEHGADIYSRTSRRDTSFPEKYRYSTTLQVAVECSEFAAINMLLEAASKPKSEAMKCEGETLALDPVESYVNSLDHRGRSTLHYLMERRSTIPNEEELIMSILLKRGADPNTVCKNDITVLHVAAAIGSLAIVQSLIEKGLDIKNYSRDGATVLHAAAGGNCSTASVISYLIDKGMDPLDTDQYDNTTLHHAAACCNTIALEALIKAVLGIDSMSEIQTYGSAAPTTSNSNDSAMIDLKSRAQILMNRTDCNNETLLHILGTKGERHNGKNKHDKGLIQVNDTTRMLLDLGADKNKRNHKGRTPLSTLVIPNDGCRHGAAIMLLDRGADPDLPDLNGKTPLHYAARCFYEEAMEDLIKAGADIEARDHKMCTPLHEASRAGFPHVVQFLLIHKAHHGAKNLHGATPLHYSAQRRTRVISVLIKAKADINAVDNSGSTPLHWAAKLGKSDRVGDLLSAGADPDTLDNCGRSAMVIAAEQASIVREEPLDWADFLDVWFQLYRASEKRCHDKSSRSRGGSLKRSQSLRLRTDQTWGVFDHIRAEEISRLNF